MKGTSRVIKAAGAAAVVVLCASAAWGGQGGGDKLIDKVVAVVEDRSILLSDVDLEYSRYLMQQKKSSLPPDQEKEMKKEILDGLIADQLLTVHAEKVGVEVTDERIDSEVEKAIEENISAAGGEAAFMRELGNAGMTISQLRTLWREKIKSRRLIEGLMYREVMSDLQVTEGETREYYRNHLNELPMRPATVSLAQILILPVQADSAKAVALEKCRIAKERLDAGEDFAEVAKEMSEGPSAPNGGNLGFMKLDDLGNPALREAVSHLTEGQVSGPVLTEHGYHLVKLEMVREDEVHLRHILFRVEGDEAATERKAERIRSDIAGGASFEEMARLYSEDWTTKDEGGVIGEVPLENLPDFFVKVIKEVEPGGVTPVIREQKGFRIVKVLGWNPAREYSYDEAKDQLKNLIQQQKLQEKYTEYVGELKKLYYVDIKGTV